MPTTAVVLNQRNAARPVPSVAQPPATPFLKWVGGKGKLERLLSAWYPPGVELMRHVDDPAIQLRDWPPAVGPLLRAS